MSDQLRCTNKLSGLRVLIIGGTPGLGFGAAQALLEQNISELILSSGYPCNLADEANPPANVLNLFSQIGPLDPITFTAGDTPLLTSFLQPPFDRFKVAGMKPIPRGTVTSSYLAGLQGMMRGLALDQKPIRVNLVGSGGVDTEMWDLLEGEAREGVGNVGDIAEAHLYCSRN
ncbi:hypothetical protein BJX68DRAFT_258153 [Aspergillus pseudodeflectus]|uniref:Uncharacterized protein n=1 Tax=Aspergillus pseudodeflectus TaxID=176178 RepID=A0ABR4JNW2_9EURO